MKQGIHLFAGLAMSCCLAASSEIYGQVYREGGYYNPYNGASAAAREGYNPYTNRASQESTRYNPYTNRDVSERTVSNPYTGRSYSERSVSNPYTGRSTESYAYRRR